MKNFKECVKLLFVDLMSEQVQLRVMPHGACGGRVKASGGTRYPARMGIQFPPNLAVTAVSGIGDEWAKSARRQRHDARGRMMRRLGAPRAVQVASLGACSFCDAARAGQQRLADRQKRAARQRAFQNGNFMPPGRPGILIPSSKKVLLHDSAYTYSALLLWL